MTRKEDDTLNHIELKLTKHGVDTDDLFHNRSNHALFNDIDLQNIKQSTLKQIATNPAIDSDEDEEQQLENLKNVPTVNVHIDDINESLSSHLEEDNTQSNEKRIDKTKQTKIIQIDSDRDINFKPSKHSYPGLSDVKPVSALSVYKPITSKDIKDNKSLNKQSIATQIESNDTKQSSNDHSHGKSQVNETASKKFDNLQYKKPQHQMNADGTDSLYPAMHKLGPKPQFKKYEPFDPKKMAKEKQNESMDEDNDDLLDALDDVNDTSYIGQQNERQQLKGVGTMKDSDGDLLDELDDVDVPLTVYNGIGNANAMSASQGAVHAQYASNVGQHGSQPMYQQNVYYRPQHGMVPMNNAQHVQNVSMNNNGYPMIGSQQRMNTGNVSNAKQNGYPKIAKKNGNGGYPNIYTMPKPKYKKHGFVSDKDAAIALKSDNGTEEESDDEVIDDRQFSV